MTALALAALVFGIVLLGSSLQRLGGMGLALVSAPVISIALGPIQGVLLVNILAAVNATVSTVSMRKDIRWKTVGLIASLMWLGAALGALLISRVSVAQLQTIVGAMIALALVVVVVGAKRVPQARGSVPPIVAGLVAGFTNTLAGVAGPVITVYGQAARMEFRHIAASLQPLFVISGLLSFAVKEFSGAARLDEVPWQVWPAAVGAVFLGNFVGAVLANRIDPQKARKLGISIAFAGALSVFFRGVMAL